MTKTRAPRQAMRRSRLRAAARVPSRAGGELAPSPFDRAPVPPESDELLLSRREELDQELLQVEEECARRGLARDWSRVVRRAFEREAAVRRENARAELHSIERNAVPRARASFGSPDLEPVGPGGGAVQWLSPMGWQPILARYREAGRALDVKQLVALVWGSSEDRPSRSVPVNELLDFEDRAVEDVPELLVAAILFYRPLLPLVAPLGELAGEQLSLIDVLEHLVPADEVEREGAPTYLALIDWVGTFGGDGLAAALPWIGNLRRLPPFLAELERRLGALGYELTPSGAPRRIDARHRGEAARWETLRYLALVKHLRKRCGVLTGKAGVRGTKSQRPALLAIYRDAYELLRGAFPFLQQRSDAQLEALYNRLRSST